MTRTEWIFIASFLKELSDRFNDNDCNDMFLVDTPENRQLVLDAQLSDEDNDDPRDLLIMKKKIATSDYVVLDYLKKKFMKENNIQEEEIIDTQNC